MAAVALIAGYPFAAGPALYAYLRWSDTRQVIWLAYQPLLDPGFDEGHPLGGAYGRYLRWWADAASD